MTPRLTSTERQVVRSLIGNRRTYAELAPALRMAPATFRTHVNNIAGKLPSDVLEGLPALRKVRRYFEGHDLAA